MAKIILTSNDETNNVSVEIDGTAYGLATLLATAMNESPEFTALLVSIVNNINSCEEDTQTQINPTTEGQ